MKIRTLLILFSLGGAGAQTTYTVQAGDTLSSVARRYQTTPAALLTLNALPSTTIQVGQTLHLPPPPQHTVQAGETLYSIARQSGTTPEALIALNGLSSSTLRVGRTLQLTDGPPPSAVSPAVPAPSPVVTTATPPGPSLPSITVPVAGRLERGLFTPGRLPAFTDVLLRTASLGGPRPASAYLPEVGFGYQTLNNCGPAAVAAALNAYGREADQRTWQARLRPTGSNMYTEDAGALLTELGFEAPALRGGTIENVKRHVADGHPVIVLQYHSVLGKTPHFRVVRGYDDAQGILIMSDSLSGPNVALTEHDFDLLWNTQGRQYLPVEPPQG